MPVGGLTETETKEWCKDKKDYKELWLKKNKNAAEISKLRLMMEEYRDWNRLIQIENRNRGLKYNPKIHTSKIFNKLRGL